MASAGALNEVVATETSQSEFDLVAKLKQQKKMSNMDYFVRPDLPSKCTWHRGCDPSSSPHTKVPLEPPKKIMPNILHAIGNTPLVRLNHIPQREGIKCEILVKCEFFNPGGSVKDRIGYRMVEDAEKKGILKPGYTIIEPTSGNTGIGLAMASVVKGYRCIIVMPDKMSDEKVNVLKSLGAEIIRTPIAAAFDSPDSLIAVAQRLHRDIPNSVILDQYRNPGNPLAHYDNTAAEIYEQCDGKLDVIVVGAGTGGTITGIGRRIKELCPDCQVIGVDPDGSILAEPEILNKSDTTYYELEGIGYDFIPTVLDRHVVDKWYKVDDKTCFTMARRLIKEEGLLCGGSSGAAVAVALKVAANLKEGQRCVTILPDSIRNYMTKFVSDHWMEARHLMPCVNTQNHWWWDTQVSKLNLESPISVLPNVACLRVLNIMKKQGFDQMPVIDKNGSIEGMATINHLMSMLVASKVKANDPINNALVTKYMKVHPDTGLGLVSRILEKDSFVLVLDGNGVKERVVGLITMIDILQYIADNESKNGASE